MSKNKVVYKRKHIKFRNKYPKTFKTLLSFVLVGGVSVLAFSYYSYDVILDTPEITETDLKTQSTSKMYDKDGNIIWQDNENKRDYINESQLPQLYKDLLITVEDKDFYTSNGYSVKGVMNATYSLVKEKLGSGKARGGSTLEQQLIKNVKFSSLDKDRTIDRKIKEIWLASQLDKNFTKEQILEWYVNYIYLGENSYGVNTISNTYFGKDISSFKNKTPENISKLAIIVGLGQSPSTYNLYDNPKAVEDRRNIILEVALNDGLITKQEYESAKQVDVIDGLVERYSNNTEVLEKTKIHNAYITATLQEVKKLGYDLSRTSLQIHTNLDSDEDKWLKETVDNFKEYQDDKQQVAITVIDNEKKIVTSQYGGRGETDALGYNRATSRNRSTGSAIKPFLSYGSAIEYLGYGTSFILSSKPYVYPGTNITAYNYGGYDYGNVDSQYALRMSLNTPAIRLLDEHIGSARAKEFLSKQGLDVKDSYGGSDALGLDLSTYDMANAFSTLSTLGVREDARYIDRIVFGDNSVKQITSPKEKAMNESTAYILLKMLEGVAQDNFTATDAKTNFKGYAVKTGTVGYALDGVRRPDRAASDVWIAGTTKSKSVAIWSGYDEPNGTNSWINDGYKGNQKLFKQIMENINSNKDTSDWEMPNNVVSLGGSGLNAHYKPKDVNFKTYNSFTVDGGLVFDDYKVSKYENADIKEYEVSDKEKEEVKDWKENLNDRNKELLKEYKKGLSVREIIELIKDELKINRD